MRKIINPVLIIIFAAGMRFVPHPPNVAPIAAMALFGGAYLNKRYALVVPLLAMIISDIFLGFHETMPYVYGSFLLIGLWGMWLKNHKQFRTVVFASFCSSLLFFIITNFGVWFAYNFYPKTVQGLMDCYIAGLPFFRNTLLGDLFYTGLFFGGFELIFKLFPKPALK